MNKIEKIEPIEVDWKALANYLLGVVDTSAGHRIITQEEAKNIRMRFGMEPIFTISSSGSNDDLL